MASFRLAFAMLPIAALTTAGCGGGQQSAATLSTSCAARPDATSSGDLLWLGGSHPRVYYVDGQKVISSRGRGLSLPRNATAVGFRACRTPLVLYTIGKELRATALPHGSGAKARSLGSDAFVTPDGRLVSFSGLRVRYAGSSSFVVRGLPDKWIITSLVASPRDPQVLLASAQSPEAGIETCGKGLGGIYRISPGGTKAIFIDNPCRDNPQAAWSPDGSRISYVGGPSNDLYVLDARGTQLRRVTSQGDVLRYLWSPDGTRVAYSTQRGTAAVIAMSGRRIGSLGHGAPLAWSPDGREVALAAAGRSLIEAVPAAGGRSRVLLRLPKA
jgi:WD40 repeat protein